jgi:hypothetical protein
MTAPEAAPMREDVTQVQEPCEGGAHCCCCVPGQPCCDCGEIIRSRACMGENCWCGAPAAKKVGEEIPFDDPEPHRHNLTAYVCAHHYVQMMGPRGTAQVGTINHSTARPDAGDQVERLREALRPFAEHGAESTWLDRYHDDEHVDTAAFTAKDFRHARAALAAICEGVDREPRCQWPPLLTPALRHILGMMCFQLGAPAHLFQKIGEFNGAEGITLGKRAEDEQAFMLHKLLGFWFERGEDWRAHASADLTRAKAAAAALSRKEGTEA